MRCCSKAVGLRALCVQMLKPACLKERMAGHEIWQCMPLRAYYRAMYGVANTLRKMGRCAEVQGFRVTQPKTLAVRAGRAGPGKAVLADNLNTNEPGLACLLRKRFCVPKTTLMSLNMPSKHGDVCAPACRYEESFAAYEQLLNADGNWYSWSSYVNVMALYPFVVLGAKGSKVSWLVPFQLLLRLRVHTKRHFWHTCAGCLMLCVLAHAGENEFADIRHVAAASCCPSGCAGLHEELQEHQGLLHLHQQQRVLGGSIRAGVPPGH